MRIKSYFADSIQVALEKARLELGPEAMLMNSRKADPESKRLGVYEVVFGVSGDPAPAADPVPAPAPPLTARPAPPVPEPITPQLPVLSQQLDELRKEMELIRKTVARPDSPQPISTTARTHSDFDELKTRLLGLGFSPDTALELAQAVETRMQVKRPAAPNRLRLVTETFSPELIQTVLVDELESRIAVAPSLGNSQTDQQVVALVGPPGSGKTTTLVKLAINQAISMRKPAHILTTDTLRVGASEQLGTYSRIIGVGFDAIHIVATLGQSLEEHRSKKLIFIDTPGFGPSDMDQAEELAAFFERNRQIEVHLVLPALLRAESMSRIIKRFAIFHPSKLLFTHLDDAETSGAIVETAIKSGLPVSYLANGQQIPEDIADASKARLMQALDQAPLATAAASAA